MVGLRGLADCGLELKGYSVVLVMLRSGARPRRIRERYAQLFDIWCRRYLAKAARFGCAWWKIVFAFQELCCLMAVSSFIKSEVWDSIYLLGSRVCDRAIKIFVLLKDKQDTSC